VYWLFINLQKAFDIVVRGLYGVNWAKEQRKCAMMLRQELSKEVITC
jgi:hypothetical protein